MLNTAAASCQLPAVPQTCALLTAPIVGQSEHYTPHLTQDSAASTVCMRSHIIVHSHCLKTCLKTDMPAGLLHQFGGCFPGVSVPVLQLSCRCLAPVLLLS